VLPVELVFRSIGYRGVPLPGVPFYENWGVIPNEDGRVLDAQDGEPVQGQYAAGWIKRGATGVIGTNKPDAVETVECLLEDAKKGQLLQPEQPERDAVVELIETRQPDWFSYEDWLRLDEAEVARGEAQDRPRVKFTSVEAMVEAIHELREARTEG
jgi:ferredoxin--NADP+ reductase